MKISIYIHIYIHAYIYIASGLVACCCAPPYNEVLSRSLAPMEPLSCGGDPSKQKRLILICDNISS